MATYSNKHWLLSHIRNSFISTDDTGISELVMNSDDLAKSLAQQNSKSGEGKENFTVYPGLTSDLAEQDDELLSQSFEINFAQESGFFRFRTGTDAKLDKMSDMRKKQEQIRTVCIMDPSVVKINSMQSYDQDQEELFIRKEFSEFCLQPKTSMLAHQIENLPPMPVNRFRQFSSFDGTSHPHNEIKNIHVFIVPFAKEQRNYPIRCCVQATAKIDEFIGFILFKCTQDFAEASKDFEEVKDYGLFITDETGEPDLDFPALDSNEQVRRFQFAYLALAKRVAQPFQSQRAFSVVSDTLPLVGLKSPDASNFPSRRTDEIAMFTHDTMVSAPNYRAYRVFFISKKHFRTEIQLGIDGEKIEIDPLQQKASIIFKAAVKAIHYSMDSVAWCEISSRKSSRFEFKIAHDPLYFDPLALGTSSSLHESSTQTTLSLKVHTFETDPTTAEEIALKINNILKLKNSSIYREHPNRSDKTKKSFIKRKKFPI